MIANVTRRPGRRRPLRRRDHGLGRAARPRSKQLVAETQGGARPRRQLLARREPLLQGRPRRGRSSSRASPTTTPTSWRSTTARRRTRPRARRSVLARILEAAPGPRRTGASRRLEGAIPERRVPRRRRCAPGGIVGEHTVGFDSGGDEILLEHRARYAPRVRARRRPGRGVDRHPPRRPPLLRGPEVADRVRQPPLIPGLIPPNTVC